MKNRYNILFIEKYKSSENNISYLESIGINTNYSTAYRLKMFNKDGFMYHAALYETRLEALQALDKMTLGSWKIENAYSPKKKENM